MSIRLIKVNTIRRGANICVVPFSLFSLQEQKSKYLETDNSQWRTIGKKNGNLERIENACKYFQSITDTSQTISWSGVLIGGSLIKNSCDAYSDTDISFIFCDKKYPELKTEIQKKERSAIGYREEIEFPEKNRLDIRYLPLSELKAAIAIFNERKDCSSSIQDTLFNLKDGYYLYQSFELREVLLFLEFQYAHTIKIYENNRPFIKRYDFRKFLIREDQFTYFEMLNILFSAFVHILYAVNGRFFGGYRNLTKNKNTFQVFPVDVISAFENAYSAPSLFVIEELHLYLDSFIGQIDIALEYENARLEN
jgi:hypothetical protein